MVSSIGGSRRIYPHCLVCGTQRGDGHWTPSRPGGLGPFSLVRHGRRASSFALHHPSPFHSRATVRNLVRHPHHWPIQRPTVSAGGARPCGQTALGSWGAGPGEGKTNNNPDTTGDEMDGERKKVQALSASVPFLQFTSSHLIPSVSSPAQLVGYSRPGCIHCPAKSLRGVMDRGHGRGAFADNTSASVCSGSGSVTALVPSWPQQQPSAISHPADSHRHVHAHAPLQRRANALPWPTTSARVRPAARCALRGMEEEGEVREWNPSPQPVALCWQCTA